MKRKKLVLIQFSRALVPLMVMFFHVSLTMDEYFGFNFLGLASLPMSGGVNYFFALSGFMVYYIYKDKLGQPKQLKNYLLNRFIRIYPLYWLLTLVLLPFLIAYPWYGAGHELQPSVLISSLFLIPNPQELEPVLIVAWSLVHTVFFYLVFSVLFFRQKIVGKGVLALWAVLIVVITYGALPADHFLLQFIFNEEGLIFLGGIVCAFLVTRIRVPLSLSVLSITIGLAGFPFMWYNALHSVAPINFDEGTGLASLFLIFGLASFDMKKDVSIPHSLNYLGNAAFSIYLSHTMILDLAAEIVEYHELNPILGQWLTTSIFLVLMIAGGCAVHSYIEKPLQQKLKRVIFKKEPVLETSPKLLAKEK